MMNKIFITNVFHFHNLMRLVQESTRTVQNSLTNFGLAWPRCFRYPKIEDRPAR